MEVEKNIKIVVGNLEMRPAYNTGYTAHFVRPNRLSPTSYSPKTLGETVALLEKKYEGNGYENKI